uniref:Protein N-lysine methyltransferase METTL21A n=1 Tax=Leptobrachium leishanense TaxID=445787 RepID=A0A8C5PUH4_9ANUR
MTVHKARSIKTWMTESGVDELVWPAVVLCIFLEAGSINLKGSSVIELGAGTGLVGIVAALLGKIIRGLSMAVEFLELNVKENLPKDLQGNVFIKPLTWGQSLENFPTFDVIVGADIIYLEETFPDLLKTILHLSSEHTLVLLSFRLRYQRDQNFLDMMKEHFNVKEVHYDSHTDVHIYKAHRKGSQTKEL